jgi:hypothetical protein
MRGGSWVRRSIVSGGEQAEPTRVDYVKISEISQIRKINHGGTQEKARRRRGRAVAPSTAA